MSIATETVNLTLNRQELETVRLALDLFISVYDGDASIDAPGPEAVDAAADMLRGLRQNAAKTF